MTLTPENATVIIFLAIIVTGIGYAWFVIDIAHRLIPVSSDDSQARNIIRVALALLLLSVLLWLGIAGIISMLIGVTARQLYHRYRKGPITALVVLFSVLGVAAQPISQPIVPNMRLDKDRGSTINREQLSLIEKGLARSETRPKSKDLHNVMDSMFITWHDRQALSKDSIRYEDAQDVICWVINGWECGRGTVSFEDSRPSHFTLYGRKYRIRNVRYGKNQVFRVLVKLKGMDIVYDVYVEKKAT